MGLRRAALRRPGARPGGIGRGRPARGPQRGVLRGLGRALDLVFSDPSDRDDGFDRKVNGDGGRSRWSTGDYARDVRWLAGMHRATGLPIAMWQIPLGNARLPDKRGRYRDTHVERLLGADPRWRRAYRDAGVIAFLFGGGADGTTSERTDGDVFRRYAARYARARLRVQ